MDRVQALRFFQALNHERIQRLLQLAPDRHRLILELLPFLLHINNKLLPGYLSDDAPAGLIDYRPDKKALDRAKQLEKSFRYRRRALRRYPLRGLYLLNPHGQLNYPHQPEFEVWLMFSDLLKDEPRQLLAEKVRAVSDWAALSGFKLQFHLFSESDIAQNKLNSWQRDQFYSNSLVIAGSQPYWWLTSPTEDENYVESVQQLKSQRMLNQVSLVDFGPVNTFEPEELFQHTVKRVSHCLQHGDGLLELYYLAACLQQNNAFALSPLLKQQIYQQQTDIAFFDSDYLKLELLEQKKPDTALREAYYLMSREPLSKPVRQALVPWRRSFIYKVTEDWAWDKDILRDLDHRKEDIKSVRLAHQKVGQVCQVLIQQLQTFHDHYQLADKSQLTQLKKIYRYRHAPGLDQIETLPQKQRPATTSERLFLTRFSDDHRWFLSLQPMSGPGSAKLFEHESLLQILGFAISNQLLSRSNWLSVTDQHQKITTTSVVELAQQLLRSPLSVTDLMADSDVFEQPETLTGAWLFINLQQQPTDNLTQQGLQLSSKLNDPLNYSSYRHSLVMSVDGLIQSSYGVFYSFDFRGEQAALEAIRYMLSWQPDPDTQSHCWCPTAIFGQVISSRIDDLLKQVFSHYQRYQEQGRYLLDIAGRPYSLQWQQEQVEIHRRPASQDIWHSLASNQTSFSASKLDPYLDKDGLFLHLLAYQSPQQLSVFIYSEQHTIICYVLDEFGNLDRHQYQQLTESTLLSHLQRFLSEIKQQNQIPHLRFYRLSRQQDQWQTLSVAPPQQLKGYLPVKVSMSSIALDADCQITCGQKTFTGQADDPALFSQVHNLVLTLRQQDQSYPVYLNSLSFNDKVYHPAAIYMQHKQRLEQLFNPE